MLVRSLLKSNRRAAQEIGIKSECLQKIIVKYLKFFPYKVQMHHRLSVVAVEQRLEFASDVLDRIDNNNFDVMKV